MKCCLLEGHFILRERLALSILFQRNIQIINIRSGSSRPGLRKFEIQLFSLIDKIIPDSIFRVNEKGTKLYFVPGSHPKKKVIHQMEKFRSLSYYLEFILYLLNPNFEGLEIKLSGLRSSALDVSLESILYVTIPLFRRLGANNTRVKIFSNSFSSIRNTELIFICSRIRFQESCQFLKPGLLKKLRVIFSHSQEAFPVNELFAKFIKRTPVLHGIDLSFFNFKIPNQNLRFCNLTVIGETSTGCVFGCDFFTNKKILDSNFGKKFLNQIFFSFLEDLKMGGCIDNRNYNFFLIKILKRKSNDSILRIGKLTLSSILFFRDIKKITGIIYKINPSLDKKSLILTTF